MVDGQMHKDACRFKMARTEETPDERMTKEQNGTQGGYYR